MTRLRAGRYELLRRLGSGSIGVVFEAIDHHNGQRVAVKQLRPLVPAGAYRLQREFDVLRGLRHPNVVQYYELYTDENPAFITMELIEGQDFVSYVRPGSSGIRRAIPRAITDSPLITEKPALPAFSKHVNQKRLRDALRQLVPAVQAIHAAGVIHRDLKPSNVLVDGEGRVVVMDFSIATEARSYADEATSGGVMIGTPEYMAPEQAAGEAETSAADWYALGAMMYVAMTGRVPFEGSWNQVVENKQAYDPPLADTLVDGAPDDLVQLCAALISRHPDKRPNAAEIRRQLGIKFDITAVDEGSELKWVGLAPPFVGRTTEMATLRALFAQVDSRAGAGAAALITGQPGLGKSRLLDEFIEQAQAASSAPILLLRGLCHPHDPRCYNAFEQLARQLSCELQSLNKAELAEVLPEDRQLLPRMFSTFLRVAGIERSSRTTRTNLPALRIRAVDALYELLARLADERPVIIAIDNVHWADRDSVALLCDLFATGVPVGVMVVLAGRAAGDRHSSSSQTADETDGDGRSELTPDEWRALRAMVDSDLPLTELAHAEQDELFRLMSGRERDPAELPGPRIGVPLLLIERIQRVLAARPGDGGGADSSRSVDLFAHHIDRLPRTARVLLQAIAMMGSPAPLSALAKAADLSIADRGKAIDALRTAGLVVETHEGHEPWVWAAHDEIHIAALRAVAPGRQRELHLRLAMALQRTGNTRDTVLGARWRAAGDLERAFAFQERAAKSANERFAFHRAADTYAQALEAAHPDSVIAGQLTLWFARAAFCARRFDEATLAYQQVIASGRHTTADVHWRAAEGALRAGDFERALASMRDLCGRLGVEKLARQPERRTGRWSMRAREALAVRRARRLRDESEVAAVELQRTDGLQDMALALLALAPTFGANLQSEQLLATLRHGEKLRVGRARSCELLYQLTRASEITDADSRRAALALEDVSGQHDPHGAALASLCNALVHQGLGSLEDASGLLQRAVDTLTQHCPDSHWVLSIVRFWQFMNASQRGRMADYSRFLARAIAHARRAGDRYHWTLFGALPNTWRLMWFDRVGDGLGDDHEFLDIRTDDWSKWAYVLRAMVHLARAMALVYLQRPEPAAQALTAFAKALGKHRAMHVVWFEPLHLDLRARVALMRGQTDRADKLARQLAHLNLGVAAGHADVVRAVIAFRHGDHAACDRRLQRAETLFVQQGAELFAMSARWRMAELANGARAQTLRAEVTDWCHERGLVNVERMLSYLCPWSSSHDAQEQTMRGGQRADKADREGS